jgi:predicted nucleotidyltransferase
MKKKGNVNMEKTLQSEMTKRYQAAADSFADKMKGDPNVVAVIICGSLAYDQVWEKSDIDMTLVVRDMLLKNDSYCIVEDDITINVALVVRSNFKRYLDGTRGGSFFHSYLSRGKIIYSTDDSLNEFFEEFKVVGRDDIAMSAFLIACELVHAYDKCLKWLTVKQDPLYSQYYLLKAVESLARMEVILHGESPSREAILKAYTLNPNLITSYYQEAMSHHYSSVEVLNAIHGIDRYLMEHLDIIKKPVLDYMSDHEMKTVTMITKYFRTESHFISGIFDYLADKGVICKVSQTIRITPKSRPVVEEIAYQCP